MWNVLALVATTKFKEYTPIVHFFLSNLVKTEILWWRNWLKVDFFSGAFPTCVTFETDSFKDLLLRRKNIRASKNVSRITTKFLTEIVHNFGRKSNISDRTLHSLPWCFFVRNFLIVSCKELKSKTKQVWRKLLGQSFFWTKKNIQTEIELTIAL